MAPPAPLGIEPPRGRRAAKSPAITSVLASSLAVSLASLIVAALVLLAPQDALAYPNSIISVPTGEALAFGTISSSASLNFRFAPQPVDFSTGWIGFGFGTVPSVTLASSALGDLTVGGIEGGFDVFGPSDDGGAAIVLNLKAQFLQETDYLPAFSVGIFQVSPDPRRNALLGYFALSKSFYISGRLLGQATFGMMTSFADRGYLVPGCLDPSAPYCLFRGAAPFEQDKNVGLLLAYRSPRIGPMGISIDHVGGSSAVSSTNVALTARVLPEVLYVAAGFYFGNDRREPPRGAGFVDGFFLSASLYTSVPDLFRSEQPVIR